MEETKNSMKLDIEAVRLSAADTDRDQAPRESYKPIPEYPTLTNNTNSVKTTDGDGLIAVKNSNMVREKSDNIEDGAAETMLNNQEKEQLAQKEEVKFIPAQDHKNGDAKIDIGALEKSFTGMTKDELMRYANDPFWVRLRWIFFILFWGLWVAMLVGAIMIIIGAPKCAPSAPLPWYKEGPLILINDADLDKGNVALIKDIGAKGVIYELKADDTYLIHTPDIESHIKNIVDTFKTENIQVILDVTANYVNENNELYQMALNKTLDAATSAAYRSAFIFSQSETVPNNWKSIVSGSAWKEYEEKNFVLSQFGENRFDLQMNSTLVKNKFKDVLIHLMKLGVRGVRLTNAAHFIISKELTDEELVQHQVVNPEQYGEYTHRHSTYQSGLGDLFAEYLAVVKNTTNGEGFLSVTDNIVNPEVFQISVAANSTTSAAVPPPQPQTNSTSSRKPFKLGIELPVYGLLPKTLASPVANNNNKAKQLKNELTEMVNTIGKDDGWVQWQYDQNELNAKAVGLSEYNTFIMLLPGVPVANKSAFLEKNSNGTNVASKHILELEKIRELESYQQGSFDVYTDANETVIAYTRIRSGTPGYFVAYNPTDVGVSSDFSKINGMPDQLTVHLFSENYNLEKIVEKTKVPSSAIPIAAKSVIILTYVPKQQ